MRIQILPRSTGSSRDFCKISVAFFIIVYVFLWLSKPAVDNELNLASHKTPFVTRNMVVVNITATLTKNEFPNEKVSEFNKQWCRERQARLDWKGMLSSCRNKMAWNSSRDKANATDPNTSFISLWDTRPAGEYSRFSIQSQTKKGRPKTEGGDSWRVLIRGPSSISPTVFDHGNGTYEVLFLAMEAGLYRANVILDFTLCNGFKDPPVDWFIVGEFGLLHFPLHTALAYANNVPRGATAHMTQYFKRKYPKQNVCLCLHSWVQAFAFFISKYF